MFAIIAGERSSNGEQHLEAMAQAIRGSARPARSWWGRERGVGFAASVAGVLPEDLYDRQPIVQGHLVFAAQVRLDNRSELCDRLEVASQDRSTLADSELLYRAYFTWGTSCMQYLCGDYSFCVLHRDSGRLIAATDHLGTGRLFYTQSAGGLVVSAQMRSMIAHPNVSHTPDIRALGLLVLPKMCDEDTSITGVKLLRGGHLLIHHQDGRLETQRWWRPEEVAPQRNADPRECLPRANAIFARAVNAQLRTTGKVSAMMSAGLDSTLVAGVAAAQLKESGKKLTAYTSAPEIGLACEGRTGWDDDESALAAEMSQRHTNLRLVIVRPEGRCSLDVLPGIHESSATCVRNTANHVWMEAMLRCAAATGSRVMLHGVRGNAGLSMSGPSALNLLLRDGSLKRAMTTARAEQDTGGASAWRTLASVLARGRVRSMVERLRGQRQSPLRSGSIFLRDEFLDRNAVEAALPSPRRMDRNAMLDFMTMPSKMWVIDSMAHCGVEMRDPTADRELIELLLSFPHDMFLFGGRSRGLVRAMGEGVVPDSIRLRRQRGSQMPEMSSLIAAHAGAYRAVLDRLAESTTCLELLRLDRLRAAVNLLARGEVDNATATGIDRALDVGTFLIERNL